MELIWSKRKRCINLSKHGIDFRKLKSLFENPLLHSSTSFYDSKGTARARQRGYDEERWILVGFSDDYKNWLIISFTVTKDQEVRIISARKARKKDKRRYHI